MPPGARQCHTAAKKHPAAAGMLRALDALWELEDIIDDAALTGDLQLLAQLHPVAGPLFTDALCTKLAYGGHLKTLKFLRSLTPPCPLSLMACELAAQEGFYDVTIWLMEHGPPGGPSLALERTHNADIIQWIYDHTRLRLNAQSASRKGAWAAGEGNWKFIAWLLRPQSQAVHPLEDSQWRSIAVEAATYGHKSILMCLADAGKILRNSKDSCLVALARNRNWPAFRSLILHPQMRAHAHNGGADDDSDDEGARNSEPDEYELMMLKSCASQAARQGRLDVLQWLAVNIALGAVACREVAAAAALNGNTSMLAFLQCLRPPPCWDLCYDAAIGNGDLATLEWLYTHGFPLDLRSPHITPISKAPAEVVPWMAVHMPSQAWLEACNGGRLLYLTQHGCLLPSEQMRSKVAIARACFCAYYGAARRLSRQQCSQSSLGSLSNDLLQTIACHAQIDFCPECNDQSEQLDSNGEHDGAARKTMQDLLGEEHIYDDDDEDMTQAFDELAGACKGLSLADTCMQDAEDSQLQKDFYEDRKWLAECLHAPDVGSDEDDPEWLWDGQVAP